MTIRWRLTIAAVQLIILTTAVYLVEGSLATASIWYVSGLLAIVVNPALLEPYYPRPGDVVANSVIGLVLIGLAEKDQISGLGVAGAMVLVSALIAGLAALVLGAGRRESSAQSIGSAARLLSQAASARVIYSIVFWLGVLEEFPVSSTDFVVLAAAWGLIMIAGGLNWQRWWGIARAGQPLGVVEGLLGPTLIRVSALDIPNPGDPVILKAGDASFSGVVIKRIRRFGDSWGEIHVASQADAERLLAVGHVFVTRGEGEGGAVGSVGAGSTHRQLRFTAAQPLEVGRVVAVHSAGREVIYQLTGAELSESRVKGGSHLVAEATAEQVGWFDEAESRLTEHRWTPDPGAPIVSGVGGGDGGLAEIPDGKLLLGQVIGTQIPVFLDLEMLSEGHMAILGMTKMGKSSLALRIARALSTSRRVVILDQTGEHVNKRGLPIHDTNGPWLELGVFVHEPAQGDVGADFALGFLEGVIAQALDEYEHGDPTLRSIFIDEAHQFVPEPAGLGFNAPGRDAAYRIGTLMMQIRKYGLSIVLISQRTAVVAKSALSQCENLIAFRSVDQTGLDYLEQVGGPGVRNVLPALRQGEALVMGPAISSDRPVAITVAQEGESAPGG